MSGLKLATTIVLTIAVGIVALWLWLWPKRGVEKALSAAAPAIAERSEAPREDVREDVRETGLEDSTRSEADLDLPHLAVREVEIRVTDESGATLAGGTLRIRGRSIDQRRRSGPDGFTFVGVPFGSLDVIAENFPDAYEASETHEIIPGDGAQGIAVRLRRVVRIPVLLRTPQGERLRDRVADGFPGFPRVPVVLADREPFGRRIVERAPIAREPWRAGRLLAPRDKEHDGVLECLSPPPLHVALVLGDSVLEHRIVSGGERELAFVLDEGAIASQDAGLTARIVDGTTGAVPPLDPTSIPRGFSIVDVRHQGSSFLFPIDENGEFGVEDLTPGPIRLIVNVAGFALESRVVELDPGVVRDLGTIALWPSTCIGGHVLDRDGNPVAVELWVGRAINSPRGLEMGLGAASQVSDAIAGQGWFGICSLPREELWIGVRSSPWAVNPIRIAPRDERLEGLQLRTQRGTGVHVRIRDPRPGPTWLCVRQSDGRPIWAESILASGESVVFLSPGSYLVTAGQAEESLWSAPLELGDEAVELDLPPTAR